MAPPPLLELVNRPISSDFQEKRLKSVTPLFRDPEVTRLKSDSFCDSVQI